MSHPVFYLLKGIFWVGHYVTFFGALLFSIGKKKELPPIQDDILFKSGVKLAEEIRKRKLKSVQVVTAFIRRIEEVDPYLNALVQCRFKEALDEAKEADDLIESGTFTEEQLQKEKPLLGVPFTVKIMFLVKGLRATAGNPLWKDSLSTEDAVSVSLLKRAGGIVLATTNVPEMGSNIETSNNVHGRTNNPYDTSRTPGGSSGGEAAIVAAAGSVIGLGNDIFGSVRIPSHYCSLFAHKPSQGFVSNDGSIFPPPPINDYILTSGPICRYAEDLVLTMRLLSPENKDKFNIENTVDFKKLKIFYLTGSLNDPFIFDADQEIVRAIHNAAGYFTKAYGSTAKEIEVPYLNKAHIVTYYLLNEGTSDLVEYVTHGQVKNVNPYLETIKYFFGLSQWTIASILNLSVGRVLFGISKDNTAFYKSLNRKFIEAFENLLDENSVLLFPTFPTCAPLHYASYSYIPSVCYACVFNSTGMPVTQCPMGLNKNGLPIGIQIAGRKNNDRLTIACALELEKAFGGWIRPDIVNM